MTRSALKKVSKMQSPPKAGESTPAARNTSTTARISSNAYATGSNQNSGNFITDRPTTKVHAPPGGRSQISFGDDTTTASKPTKTPVVEKTTEGMKSLRVTKEPTPVVAKETVRAKASSGVSSNRFASGSNQNCGNFITDRPTTRVHAPPGGKSSITFG